MRHAAREGCPVPPRASLPNSTAFGASTAALSASTAGRLSGLRSSVPYTSAAPDVHIMVACPGEEFVGAHGEYRQMEQGACGGADDLWVPARPRSRPRRLRRRSRPHQPHGSRCQRCLVAHLPEGGNLRGPTVLAKFDVIGLRACDSALPTAAMPWASGLIARIYVAGAVVHINRGILRGFDDLLNVEEMIRGCSSARETSTYRSCTTSAAK